MSILGKNERLRGQSGLVAMWGAGLRRLNPDAPIGGFNHDRWLCVIRDAWDLLGSWGDAAAILNWTAADLFGVDPAAPVTRFDRAGLAVVLARGVVVDLVADRASIRSRAGAALTFRKPVPGGLPLWDIDP